MARNRSSSAKNLKFRNKLVLNQWVIDQFGVDPLRDYDKGVRPLHVLAEPIRGTNLEGLDESNIHYFYRSLIQGTLFPRQDAKLTEHQLLRYEENIVRHTQVINTKRHRPIIWKYHQWLTLLFTEIYLDRYFSDRAALLSDLNAFVAKFNDKWNEYAAVSPYTEDDLNKLCYQNATGSGKTLIMHVNILQFQHYASRIGQEDNLSRVILITPNERLTEQHLKEFSLSGIEAGDFVIGRGGLFAQASGLRRVDAMEITTLADQDGPSTVATRSLGDQNLLLVDEGHRGMTSARDEGAWFARRNMLSAKGFTFEYSATFEQAVEAANDIKIENSYARSVLFDYSYRYFYEDGFGKDYRILNLSRSFDHTYKLYLVACLLKFYQQLRIYEENKPDFAQFNIEKPLWVFVGSSVVKVAATKHKDDVTTDVAKVLQFIADFLHDPLEAQRQIEQIIIGSGQDTGLLDEDGNDIFAGSFSYLARRMNGGESAEDVYGDILRRLFHSPAGGTLTLSRIKGDSGEIALRAGASDMPFGLINVGDALGLSKHCEDVCKNIGIVDSDFTETMFAAVNESYSPVNLLIGSKKFVEGWDCWRVSTMGLMHVGKSEGAQIIQLFGRGVRLKGYNWSLKRSGHVSTPTRPHFIEELETLNIFGIEADFMQKFRDFLRDEGLPGNERRVIHTVPLNVTYDFGKKLKMLRPKIKRADGREYDFKRDAPVPTIGDVPDYLKHNTVVADWYPRIQAMQSRGNAEAQTKTRAKLSDSHLAMLDYDELYFELERFKRERSWHNLNITQGNIRALLADPSWYTLYIPPARLEPTSYDNVRLWQQVAAELIKRYCDHFYNYRKSAFIEPRLELRDLSPDDDNFPQETAYLLIADASEQQVIQAIQQIKKEIEDRKEDLIRVRDMHAALFRKHLYEPVFYVRRGGKVQITPVALNESEFQFVKDLKKYCDDHSADFDQGGCELYLLRNLSRGRGVGFFEAGNFHPDFILWLLRGGKQYISFIEPHGLEHEGPASNKILFHQRIKEVEQRLGDRDVILNSFILSWTPHPRLDWGLTKDQLEKQHVLFMVEDQAGYIGKLIKAIV